jgi:TPR repeat protein
MTKPTTRRTALRFAFKSAPDSAPVSGRVPVLCSKGRLAALLMAIWALPQPGWADPFATALAEAEAGRHGAAAAGFHALALQGDAEAAYNLALLFMTGQGVPQNRIEASFWAWHARLGGLSQARLLIERLTPQLDKAGQQNVADRLEAKLTPQAEAGDGAAMLSLAAVLHHVRPTPDLMQAHAWQSIAAALDVPGAVAARDATLRLIAPTDRPKAEAGAMAAFQTWCKTQAGATVPACTVVMN